MPLIHTDVYPNRIKLIHARNLLRIAAGMLAASLVVNGYLVVVALAIGGTLAFKHRMQANVMPPESPDAWMKVQVADGGCFPAVRLLQEDPAVGARVPVIDGGSIGRRPLLGPASATTDYALKH